MPTSHLPTLDGAPLVSQNASDVTAGAHCLHVQRGTVGLGAVTWRWPMSYAWISQLVYPSVAMVKTAVFENLTIINANNYVKF